ncbi:MAG TPA: hypothetical protein VFS33_10525 [Gemmatimonadales bacterium]|nr:hypothetical protein [Gemmatimonadales bacterium]
MYDRSYAEARREWLAGLAAWQEGSHEDYESGMDYWEWEGSPPNREYYRPDWTPEQTTAYQVYETVSEGTPKSPVFLTLDALVDWLVEQGHTRHAAERFAKSGWAPSMVVMGGQMASNIDVHDLLPDPSAALPGAPGRETAE